MSNFNLNFSNHYLIGFRPGIQKPEQRVDGKDGDRVHCEGPTGGVNDAAVASLNNLLKKVQDKTSQLKSEQMNVFMDMQTLGPQYPKENNFETKEEFEAAKKEFVDKMNELNKRMQELTKQIAELYEVETKINNSLQNASSITIKDVSALEAKAEVAMNPPKPVTTDATQAAGAVNEANDVDIQVLAARHTELVGQISTVGAEITTLTNDVVTLTNEKGVLISEFKALQEKRPMPDSYFDESTNTFDDATYYADLQAWAKSLADKAAEIKEKADAIKTKNEQIEEKNKELEALRTEQQAVLAKIKELEDIEAEPEERTYEQELADFITNDLNGKDFDSIDDFFDFCGDYAIDLDIEFEGDKVIIKSYYDGSVKAEVTIAD